MFNGLGTGKLDDNGVEIKCGDRVSFYQYKEGYLQTHSQDGWGRPVRLCRHDQYKIPDEEKTINGTVIYDTEWAGFRVKFDDFMLNSGRKAQCLYMLTNPTGRKQDRLLVIKKETRCK